MPSITLKAAEKRRFIPADRKKGRWMKLCAIVLEFHHTPAAMSGATGHTASTNPCSVASATRMA